MITRAELERVRDALKAENKWLIERMNMLDKECDGLRRELKRIEAVIAGLEELQRYSATNDRG